MLSATLVLVCTAFGGLLGRHEQNSVQAVVVGAGIGLTLGLIILRILRLWIKLDIYKVVGGAVGTLTGALLGIILGAPFYFKGDNSDLFLVVTLFISAVCSLSGMQLGAAKGKEAKRKAADEAEHRKVVGILDTSVIIDGRIADVCETGFLDGDIIIPQFVLKELQTIADSSESTKRTRGRRGLDILNKIKKQAFVKIIIEETDYPSIKDVDQKLLHMAKETGYPLLTNDFNLNKVAEVQSIQVLNINQLANSLKPIVLPGETMKVQLLKEGKEPGQGIAYLDDGTMVVVDNGRRLLGKNVEVTVTSVLQTTAGRMIFSILKSC